MLALVAAAAWVLRDSLPSIIAAVRGTRPRWALVAGASGITLAAYALLIATWRAVLREAGGVLSPAEAMLVWLGSNLARYLPGTGWQIGVMGVMARERGVGIAASTTASLVVTVASMLTGLLVCVAGLAALAARGPTLGTPALIAAVAGAIALTASPWALPRAAALASRVTGRDVRLPALSGRAVAIAAGGTAGAWLAYGVAFWLLARAVLPAGAAPSLLGCITLYTVSYLAGWFNPMPAGIGVSEPVIILLAPQLGVAGTAEATVLALFVRAWRTVMEMGPSLVAVAIASVAGPAAGPGERP